MLRKKNLITMFSILFISLTVGLVSCSGQGGTPGSKAPGFVLEDLEGAEVSLAKYKGNVIILDFWATWCPPCRMEIPHFQELYEEYAGQGLVIIGIALDRGGASVVKPFVDSNGVTYPVAIGSREIADAYGGIRGIPTTFIIDRQGNIVDKAVGYRDKAFFEEAIKDLL